MRVVAALAVFVLCVLIGAAKAAAYGRRAQILASLGELVSYTAACIRERVRLREIFTGFSERTGEVASYTAEAARLWRDRPKSSPSEVCLVAYNKCFGAALTDGCRELFGEFAARCGAGLDTEGLTNLRERVEHEHVFARKEYERMAKLYKTLGVICGLAAAVIIL